MSRICPNCNYIRKASDNAPDWQCPSCEIAYNKGVGGANSDNYGRSAVSVTSSSRSGSGLLKWLFLVVVIGAGVWVSKPVWQTRAQASVIKAGATQPEVVLYATEWCGYCTATREFFLANGIQFIELDIEKSSAGYEGHKRLGGNGVPLVVVGDSVIHGYNEAELRSTLRPWLKKS
jgi:glutaredoxin